MTQKDKELLLKDLCSRLPYGVKGLHRGEKRELLVMDSFGSYQVNEYDAWFDLNSVIFKPYLFPLSSMTDEEQEELKQEHSKDEMLYIECLERTAKGDNSMRGKVIAHYAMDWCNKNHFDYRGLIEKGLAIDATGLNIY